MGDCWNWTPAVIINWSVVGRNMPILVALNAAACLIIKKRKSDSITVILWDNLHWFLSPRKYITNSVYLCTNVCTTWLHPISLWCMSHCRLILFFDHWSAASGDLLILHTRITSCGPHSFAVSGPRCWNGRLSALKSPSLSIRWFCCQLKTVLFCYGCTWTQPSWILL